MEEKKEEGNGRLPLVSEPISAFFVAVVTVYKTSVKKGIGSQKGRKEVFSFPFCCPLLPSKGQTLLTTVVEEVGSCFEGH